MTAPGEKNLWALGTATLDFRIVTAEMGEGYTAKLLARQTLVLGGGSAANAMVQAAALGSSAQMLSRLGGDWIAAETCRLLREAGVGVGHMLTDPAHCSPFNVAVYAGEHRRRVGGFLLGNALNDFTEQEIAAMAVLPRPGEWVLAELGEIPFETMLDFCRQVHGRGVRLMLDVDLDPAVQCGAGEDQVAELMDLCDVLVPNAEAMTGLLGPLPPQELTRYLAGQYGKTVAVTAGADGVYFAEGTGAVVHRPARKITVVDTVGAGDAFHGGLLHGLSRGLSFSEAVDIGQQCAARACGYYGARPPRQ